MQDSLGAIEKMRIEIYQHKDFLNDPSHTIFLQLNPERYSIKSVVEYFVEQPNNAAGGEQQYNKTIGDDVQFEFLFDSSGIVTPGKIVESNSNKGNTQDSKVKPYNPYEDYKKQEDVSVEPEVEAFKKLLMSKTGSTNEPAYLRLLWGNYKLDCRLKVMEIDYTLFRKNGTAIRAKVKCTFVQTIQHEKNVAKQTSPQKQTTQARTPKMNDNLLLMCEEVYGDQKYYVEVAKANKLLSFKEINPGDNIQFPPIK
jgi:hypothetical protein